MLQIVHTGPRSQRRRAASESQTGHDSVDCGSVNDRLECQHESKAGAVTKTFKSRTCRVIAWIFKCKTYAKGHLSRFRKRSPSAAFMIV